MYIFNYPSPKESHQVQNEIKCLLVRLFNYSTFSRSLRSKEL